jgi:hypothetical protein
MLEGYFANLFLKISRKCSNFLVANFPVWQISIRLTIANYQQKKQVQDLCFLEFCGFSENWSLGFTFYWWRLEQKHTSFPSRSSSCSLGFTFYWWRLEQKHTSLLSRSSNCSKLWSTPCLKARLMLTSQLLLKMLPSSTLGRAIRRRLATTLDTGLSIKLLIFQSSLSLWHSSKWSGPHWVMPN